MRALRVQFSMRVSKNKRGAYFLSSDRKRLVFRLWQGMTKKQYLWLVRKCNFNHIRGRPRLKSLAFHPHHTICYRYIHMALFGGVSSIFPIEHVDLKILNQRYVLCHPRKIGILSFTPHNHLSRNIKMYPII